MKLQTLGTAALSALIFLAVQPLSSQEGSCRQNGTESRARGLHERLKVRKRIT